MHGSIRHTWQENILKKQYIYSSSEKNITKTCLKLVWWIPIFGLSAYLLQNYFIIISSNTLTKKIDICWLFPYALWCAEGGSEWGDSPRHPRSNYYIKNILWRCCNWLLLCIISSVATLVSLKQTRTAWKKDKNKPNWSRNKHTKEQSIGLWWKYANWNLILQKSQLST